MYNACFISQIFLLIYVYEFLLIDFPLNYILFNATNFWLVLGNIINSTLFFLISLLYILILVALFTTKVTFKNTMCESAHNKYNILHSILAIRKTLTHSIYSTSS